MANPPDHASVPKLTEAAARVVGGLLGTRVSGVELLHQGMMTFKCRVRTERRDDVIVRFYPASRSALVYQEPDLLLRCCGAGLPVPQPIGDSRSGPSAPLSYVAYPRIEGETLAERLPDFDEARRRVLAEDLAGHLFRLQQLMFEARGSSFQAWRRSTRPGMPSSTTRCILDWNQLGVIGCLSRSSCRKSSALFAPASPHRRARRGDSFGVTSISATYLSRKTVASPA